MTKKFSQGNFDLGELKKQMEQIKDAASEAQKEQKEKEAKGEVTKQPLGQKIVGIVILVALVIGVGFVLISNIETLFMPKNSITLKVTDENGEAINGLKIRLDGETDYIEEFTDIPDITILGAKPGEYTLIFDDIPEGYTCSRVMDNFTLKEGGKISLEYDCTKEN